MTDHPDLIAELRALSAYPGDAYDRAASVLTSQSTLIAEIESRSDSYVEENGILAGLLSEAREEIERLTRERDEARQAFAAVTATCDAANARLAKMSPLLDEWADDFEAAARDTHGLKRTVLATRAEECRLARQTSCPIALAKPASSPAGGDVVDQQALNAARKVYNESLNLDVGALGATERIIRAYLDALSQSTSAGRVAE